MISDLLGSIGVINTLDLDQAGLGVGGAAATLVGEVATPVFTPRQSLFSVVGFPRMPCIVP